MTELAHPISRRTALHGAALAGAAALTPHAASAAADPRQVLLTAPLEAYNPYNPVDFTYNGLGYGDIIGTLMDQQTAQHVITRIWKGFQQTGNLELAEWALQYTYLYWRIVPLGKPRRKIAQAGIKFSNAVLNSDKQSGMGMFWKGAFLGIDAISIGALNAAQQIPAVRDLMLKVVEVDPTYYYATPLMAMAKLYAKTPPFPAGIGNMKKAFEYLDRARPHQERVYAMWYLFMAEALHIDGHTDEALEMGARIETNVKPVDLITQFIYDSSIVDRDSLFSAIKAGSYNKYKWDPLFTPLPATF